MLPFESLERLSVLLDWYFLFSVVFCVVLFFYDVVQSSVLLYSSLLFIILCSSSYVCSASYLTVYILYFNTATRCKPNHN
jgi:hypothetical protein